MKKRYYITFATYSEIEKNLLRKLESWGFSKISIESRDEKTLQTPTFYASLNSDGLGHNEYCFVYNKLVDTCKKKQIPCIVELKEIVERELESTVKDFPLSRLLGMDPFVLKPIKNGTPKTHDIYIMIEIPKSSINDINEISALNMISFVEHRKAGQGDRIIFSLNLTKEHEAVRYFERFRDLVHVPDLSSKVVLSKVVNYFIQSTEALPMVKA